MLLENPKVNTTSGISYSLQSFIVFAQCPRVQSSSVDNFKSSLTRDHEINDLISKSHYYD